MKLTKTRLDVWLENEAKASGFSLGEFGPIDGNPSPHDIVMYKGNGSCFRTARGELRFANVIDRLYHQSYLTGQEQLVNKEKNPNYSLDDRARHLFNIIISTKYFVPIVPGFVQGDSAFDPSNYHESRFVVEQVKVGDTMIWTQMKLKDLIQRITARITSIRGHARASQYLKP